jgi:SH3-like domain-containing protein
MGRKFTLFLAFLSILLAVPAFAQDAEPSVSTPAVEEALPAPTKSTSSGLPIPRFVTLASDKVFVRTGPALRYPIKWIYQKNRLPVEVIQEFDTWRKVRDMDGDDGWVYQSLLSGERSVIIKGEQNVFIRKSPDVNSRIQAVFEPNVVASASICKGAWCEISAQGYKGWAERKFLWGIYDQEDFD